MKNSTILSVLILMLIGISCENEEEELVKETLYYKVYIEDIEDQLEKVTFYTHTYYPKEDETAIYGDGISKNRDLSDERYLNTIDSIMYSPEMQVYNGCTYYHRISR